MSALYQIVLPIALAVPLGFIWACGIDVTLNVFYRQWTLSITRLHPLYNKA